MSTAQPPFAPMYPNIPVNLLNDIYAAAARGTEELVGSIGTSFCTRATKTTVIQPGSQKQWIGKGSKRIELAVDSAGKSKLHCFIISTARFDGKYFVFGHNTGVRGKWKYATAVETNGDDHYTVEFLSHSTHPKDLKITSNEIEDKRLFYLEEEYLVPAFNPGYVCGNCGVFTKEQMLRISK